MARQNQGWLIVNYVGNAIAVPYIFMGKRIKKIILNIKN